jgi:hypothetical protein
MSHFGDLRQTIRLGGRETTDEGTKPVLSDKVQGKRPGSPQAQFLHGEAGAVRTIHDMKILNFIHVMVARAFYSWAMKEINPMHPDVPRIMQRQRELEDKAQRIFA